MPRLLPTEPQPPNAVKWPPTLECRHCTDEITVTVLSALKIIFGDIALRQMAYGMYDDSIFMNDEQSAMRLAFANTVEQLPQLERKSVAFSTNSKASWIGL